MLVGVCTLVLPAAAGRAAQSDTARVSGAGHNATTPLPDWMRTPSYRYDPAGKPDPFVPFIRKEEVQELRPLATAPSRELGPLEKVDVTQLRAVGILWHPEGNKESLGMVQLPDGKGFVLKKGMRIGRRNGIVDAITPEAIIVKERGLDILGKERTRDVLIRLHSEKGVPE